MARSVCVCVCAVHLFHIRWFICDVRWPSNVKTVEIERMAFAGVCVFVELRMRPKNSNESMAFFPWHHVFAKCQWLLFENFGKHNEKKHIESVSSDDCESFHSSVFFSPSFRHVKSVSIPWILLLWLQQHPYFITKAFAQNENEQKKKKNGRVREKIKLKNKTWNEDSHVWFQY